MLPSWSLNSQQRDADIRESRKAVLDVVVIGGGITGAGAALDAATRGLSVALFEAFDFGHGTSSKSSKLIHGGLRYLEMLDFGLVKEALGERKRLLTVIAPHLVKPVPFVWPLTHRGWERLYMGAGLALYDTMAGRSVVPVHKHLTKKAFRDLAPGLDSTKHHGGVLFHDALEDDARMVLSVVRTARVHGAKVVSNARVSSLCWEGDRVVGVNVSDELSGEEFVVRARHVVSASGPWTNEVRGMARVGDSKLRVMPSKGVHIVIPRECIDSEVGILLRTEKSVLFIIPWKRYWLIGDTDTPWNHDVGNPVANGTDVDYVLEKANSVLTAPITSADVVGVFSGLRPLVAGDPDLGTSKLSREHQVSTPTPGFSLIAGGKYTTYRLMAADLIDAAVDSATPRSSTGALPLVGAEGYSEFRESLDELATEFGVSVELVEHLAGRFGAETTALLKITREDPSLTTRLSENCDYIGAEVVFACRHEGALTLDDVMSRRTRLRIQVRDGAPAEALVVAEIMAKELAWTRHRTQTEVAGYTRSVHAEQAALAARTDDRAFQEYLRVASSGA